MQRFSPFKDIWTSNRIFHISPLLSNFVQALKWLHLIFITKLIIIFYFVRLVFNNWMFWIYCTKILSLIYIFLCFTNAISTKIYFSINFGRLSSFNSFSKIMWILLISILLINLGLCICVCIFMSQRALT